MKKYTILLFIFYSNIIFAHEVRANIAVENIFKNTISDIISFKKEHKKPAKIQIKKLIYTNFVPFIETKYSAQQTLKKYWDKLNQSQKTILENYIVNSLIKDYAEILIGFNELSKIKISVNPNIKTKANKAIVKINLMLDNQTNVIIIKMIKTDIWKIYDIVFSGVSLVKNYASQFNSYIKRKGFKAFIQKYLTSNSG